MTDPPSTSPADSGRSPLFAELQIFVEQLYGPFRRDKIDSWKFVGIAKPFRMTDFYGKPISYEGILFDGSPRDVFWGGFAEPFLKDIFLKSIAHAAKLADERGIDREAAFSDIRGLMRMVVRGTYLGMRKVEINQLNRGRQTILSRKLPPIRWTDWEPMEARMYALVDELLAGWPPNTTASIAAAHVAMVVPGLAEGPRVDPDGLWAVVGGRSYTFKRGNQAQVIRVLYRKWESAGRTDGCGMTEDAIAEEIRTAATTFRISTTFRNSDALNRIICRVVKGTYALYLNDPKDPAAESA